MKTKRVKVWTIAIDNDLSAIARVGEMRFFKTKYLAENYAADLQTTHTILPAVLTYSLPGPKLKHRKP